MNTIVIRVEGGVLRYVASVEPMHIVLIDLDNDPGEQVGEYEQDELIADVEKYVEDSLA